MPFLHLFGYSPRCARRKLEKYYELTHVLQNGHQAEARFGAPNNMCPVRVHTRVRARACACVCACAQHHARGAQHLARGGGCQCLMSVLAHLAAGGGREARWQAGT